MDWAPTQLKSRAIGHSARLFADRDAQRIDGDATVSVQRQINARIRVGKLARRRRGSGFELFRMMKILAWRPTGCRA